MTRRVWALIVLLATAALLGVGAGGCVRWIGSGGLFEVTTTLDLQSGIGEG